MKTTPTNSKNIVLNWKHRRKLRCFLFLQLMKAKLHKISSIQEYEQLHQLAHEILPEAYHNILNTTTIDFLLETGYKIPSLTSRINNSTNADYLILSNQKPVGYVCLVHEQDKLQIDKLYIHKTHRSKGIGQEVMSFILKIASNNTITSIELLVHSANQGAIRFYEKHGFKTTQQKSRAINDLVKLCGCMMRLEL